MLAPRPTPTEAVGPPLVGCPRLLIQYIHSYPPYWRPFLHPHPEDAPCRGDRDPLITDSFFSGNKKCGCFKGSEAAGTLFYTLNRTPVKFSCGVSILFIDIDTDLFVNYNWVDTRWQWYSTHLHTNNTQNNIKKQNSQNRTYITIRIHKHNNKNT